jgi:hypothetical protein
VKVPDNAVEISGDTLTIHLVDVPVVDAFSFPPPLPPAPENGISPVTLIPAKISFDITYTKAGSPRQIHPGSRDPLSPLNWGGEMWDATNSGSFSLTYKDGSFLASGDFSSQGNFGEMGTEHNGVFVDHDEINASNAGPAVSSAVQVNQVNNGSKPVTKTVLLKGRVPIKVVKQ